MKYLRGSCGVVAAYAQVSRSLRYCALGVWLVPACFPCCGRRLAIRRAGSRVAWPLAGASLEAREPPAGDQSARDTAGGRSEIWIVNWRALVRTLAQVTRGRRAARLREGIDDLQAVEGLQVPHAHPQDRWQDQVLPGVLRQTRLGPVAEVN